MGAMVNNALGSIEIQDVVIANIAGVTASECYGIVGMASLSAGGGITDLLRRENFSKGVRISTETDKLIIDLGIIVEYGVSIAAVATNMIDNIKYNVEHMTGFAVSAINVMVKGIRV